MNNRKFVLLHEMDNVFVCCQATQQGEQFTISNDTFQLDSDITIGHKVARQNIKKGEAIIKYGVPIGSAIIDIPKGNHVHMHNMKSNYISSHTRQSVSGE